MENMDIRELLQKSGIRMWELADQMKISEPTMTRLFRRKLSGVKRERVLKAIEELQKARDQA